MNLDEQYENLKTKLEQDFTWPSVYMFKFIVAVENIEAKNSLLFNFTPKATIQQKESSGGKYCSLTITEKMKDPQEVIEIYKKVSAIPGVMAL
jgi:putative lipoic acid-binding regulatory protein